MPLKFIRRLLVKLIKLYAQNVFSLGSIELDLQNRGLTMVTGYSYDEKSANGAGKSSLVRNAIMWGLYGQVMGSARGDDIINRHSHTSADCLVSIIFDGVDGKRYRIYRTRNPATLTLNNVHGDLSLRQERKTQELINSLLGRDFKSFIQTDFFGQGRKQSFFELQPAEQKEIIDDILPIEYLKEWESEAHRARNELIERHENIDKELLQFKGKKEGLEEQHRGLVHKEANFQNELADHLDSLKRQLIEIILARESDEARRTECHYKIAGLYGGGNLPDEKDLINEQETLRTEVGLLSSNQSELRSNIKELIGELEIIHSDLNHYKGASNTCPTCEQPADMTWIREQTEKLEKQRNLKNKIRIDKLSTLRIVEYKLSKKSKRLERIANALHQLKTINESANKYQSQIVTLTSKLLNHKKAILQQEELIEQAECATNPFTGLMDDIRKEVDNISDKIDSLKKKSKKIKKEIDRVQFWHKAFSKDLKTVLFEQACPYLQNKTNYYLGLLNNSQIHVSFSTLKVLKSGDSKDEFNVTVDSKTGGGLFSLLSGGEQQMVNFAVGMALSDFAEIQVKGSSKLMILDEPFTNLDPRNCENVVSFLTEHLTKKKDTILFISNEEGLQNLVQNRIHVEKKGGISYIGSA